MKRYPRDTAVYQDCLKLFMERDGENVAEIEREMRGRLGYTNFHRRILYGRSKGSNYSPGWIERFGWKRQAALTAETPRRREAEPPASAGGSLKNSLRLREWLERVSPGMKWGWPHLRIVQEYLELVTKGEVKRLMIFMPPRHGKSELVTVRYAAKRLADDPTMNVIIGSYNQRLANRFSRKVRRVLADAGIAERSADTPVRMDASASTTSSAETQSRRGCASCAEARASARAVAEPKWNNPVPPCHCRERDNSRPPSQTTTPQSAFRIPHSAEEWETPHGGGVRAVGVGAGVTGYGASLIIIDDPVKNRAEAESKTYRDKVFDWFNDDISTRLEPDGAIILIQTRWHEDDLAGRLLKEMASGGEEWDILALPALSEPPASAGGQVAGLSDTVKEPCDELLVSDSTIWPPAHAGGSDTYRDILGRLPGEALCPERFPIEDLEKMRRRLGSYSFSALYQQRPTPLEGGLFKRKWLMNVIEKLPVGVKLVRAYDLAVSTRTTADYTASVLGGFDNRGNFYIADIMRRRLEFPEQKRFILDRMMREPHIQHGVELALHGQAIIQDLRRFAPTRAVALKGIRVATDKITRALAWAALAEERKLFLVRGPYLRDFIDEAASFPNSKHDDQIDAVSLAVSMTSTHKYRHAGF